jgi:glycosyltransferase involved in cell wall biosynthesis
VVLTPVRNEAWILDRFLAVTCRVADLILILDQGSTDGSQEIARSYPKVHLLANPSNDYDEASRQNLLLQTARASVPGEKVLLALDADEIVAADAPSNPGWRTMLAAPAGSVLCFEKPDLWDGVDRCLRYSTPWPLGYVDDGAPHNPRRVHSIRIPAPEGAPRLHLEDVKILHYALTRLDCQAAKARFYSVQESLHGTSPLRRRRASYSPKRDWSAVGRLGPVPQRWLAGWEELGIDLRSIHREAYYWHDFEVLRLFARCGFRRFWLEGIWAFDWEACRRHALAQGMSGMPDRPIVRPPWALRVAGQLLDFLYSAWGSRPRPWAFPHRMR